MKSIASRILPFAAVAVTFLSLSGVARADALPPDSCASVSDVGQSCTNAGPSYDENGICVASTCHSASPPDGGSDYACALCEVSDASAPTVDAGPVGDGGSATTTRPDAGDATSSSSDSGGCSTSPDSTDGATGFAMLALGIVGLAFGRRRKS